MVRRGVLPAICEDWTNPNKPLRSTTIAVDAESQRKREQRLPNHQALYVLANIFNRKFDLSDERVHRDIYTTSITALLMSAPPAEKRSTGSHSDWWSRQPTSSNGADRSAA